MPRKTRPNRRCRRLVNHGFNEAAARCRGKPTGRGLQPAGPRTASMRPRPDAAENRPRRRLRGRPDRAASMRPRPDAAENRPARPAAGRERRAASMRPRPDAAENHPYVSALFVAPPDASMRPRPDAAENRALRCATRPALSACFNEAAARCRGKPDAIIGFFDRLRALQ